MISQSRSTKYAALGPTVMSVADRWRAKDFPPRPLRQFSTGKHTADVRVLQAAQDKPM